jgi:Outer membrane protein beta-barrel domain
MKQVLLSLSLLVGNFAIAQIDSVANQNNDTLKVGNYYIIKKPSSSPTQDTSRATATKKYKKTIDIEFSWPAKSNKPQNIKTNWFIFDLGFTNLRDNTNYGDAQAAGYLNNANGLVTKSRLSLIPDKSSNVNIWLFMQRINLSKQKFNFKYGLGLEMYNFRYENNISYRKSPTNFIVNDTISFSKNKLYASYITVPVMFNYTANPNSSRSFGVSLGLSAGYLITSYNKQISNERGTQHIRGNLELQPFRIATIAELGFGPLRLYGSYSLNSLHNETTKLEQFPYVIGIRFSKL